MPEAYVAEPHNRPLDLVGVDRLVGLAHRPHQVHVAIGLEVAEKREERRYPDTAGQPELPSAGEALRERAVRALDASERVYREVGLQSFGVVAGGLDAEAQLAFGMASD